MQKETNQSVEGKAAVQEATRRTQRVVRLQEVEVKSPDGTVAFILGSNPERLTYTVSLDNKPVIERSQLDMRLDGYHLSSGVVMNQVESYSINETFTYHGVHSLAKNECNGVRISLTHDLSMTTYTLEVRVFNDGVAFRHIIQDDSNRTHVPDEHTELLIPAGSTAWFHGLDGHYEAEYDQVEISDVEAGTWAGPPLTFQLPENGGYGAITEANLVNYSGMALESDGRRGWRIALAHRHPINYPYELRYGREEAKRLAAPASVEGTVTTPWRVVIVARDLNALVNSDMLPSLCPPADEKLFPQGIQTSWVEPGLAVWDYVDRNYEPRPEDVDRFELMKRFSDMGGRIGAKYHIIEGFAYRWTDEQIREIVEYSNERGVRLMFWRHSNQLRTEESREEFFSRLHRLGVSGAKIDFFDHEAKENIDLYEALLLKAAEYQLVINFHGSNKPTGRLRTWPNAMIYEGIRGMESSALQQRARHQTTLPFTRYLAGPADYTTMIFTERRRDSSVAHQIASLATFQSPMLTLAAHPQSILDSPARDVIQSIQAVWDETIVLPESKIGELTVFARRSGSMWMLAVMSAGPERTVSIPLSFLEDQEYRATLVKDQTDDSSSVVVEESMVHSDDTLTIELNSGGGFVARFVK
ncbi:glycoside hydrolase [Paenibacillus sp. H1-7]|uniref:glycoside hydrolase family 97 protein n=1 Tax=Paenibacillus sp. H1-7 TaxID=2282849 RepID=UPI001EF75C68|nr:glycoside hydrolase family 97 protein [Paenibacillus sp. H1-7]ULL16279.1 glycoside hydrolase [Paenibacillus sp. H1-7]